jgi:hypothetical protein
MMKKGLTLFYLTLFLGGCYVALHIATTPIEPRFPAVVFIVRALLAMFFGFGWVAMVSDELWRRGYDLLAWAVFFIPVLVLTLLVKSVLLVYLYCSLVAIGYGAQKYNEEKRR